jgi:hypothetical protein
MKKKKTASFNVTPNVQVQPILEVRKIFQKLEKQFAQTLLVVRLPSGQGLVHVELVDIAAIVELALISRCSRE